MSVGVLFVFLVALIGCGGGGTSGEGLGGTIRIDGSSTVVPITEAIVNEFKREHPRVRIPVGVSGTGGGFAKFTVGSTDISDASRPIDAAEVEKARNNNVAYIELPVAYDGLAVVTNAENDWVECLTVQELRTMWASGSTVDSWSDVRSSFPDRPLQLYGPGTASGTYDYFTEAIVGESGASRTDASFSEDDNVLVQGIEGETGALGFFGLAYYENNADQLKLLGVDNSGSAGVDAAQCVKPTQETVRTGAYQPLSRPLFIYVRKSRADDPAMKAFVEFYLKNVGQLAEQVGYVPLSEQEYQLALQRFQNQVTGSMFGGRGAQEQVRLEERLRQSGGVPSDTSGAPSADTTAADTAAPATP